jgi:predicted  nucleic acid-binding Zn-ribbon protein
MPSDLFNEKTVERLSKKIKPTGEQQTIATFWLQELESDKLDKWASDKRRSLNSKLKDLDKEIEELKKNSRFASNLQEKHKKQKIIRKLEEKREEIWKNYDLEAQEINKKRDQLIDEIEARMEQKITVNRLFSIKWRLI